MLGNKIGDRRGKITGQRVLPSDGHGPKVETSFQQSGSFMGVETAEMGTYWSVVRPDGTLYGEGQGVLMGQNGEMGTWVGQGAGKITGPGGAVSFRGAVYVQSSSEAWSGLNAVACVYEYETDANGNTRTQIWEWK